MAQLSPADVPRQSLASDPGLTAKAVTIKDPTGEALKSFAKDMSAVSDSFQKIAEARQENEDRVAINRGELDMATRFEPVVQEMISSPDAARPDFVKRLDSRLAAEQTKVFQQLQADGYALSRNGRQRMEYQATNMRISAARRAAVAASNQRLGLLTATAEQNLSTIARTAAGSGDLDGALARVDREAASLEGVLAPDKLRSWHQAARTTVTEMVVRGHVARAKSPDDSELLRAQEIADSVTGFRGPQATETDATIIEAAKGQGVDPLALLAMAQIESGGDPGAKAKTSSAAGLFQFTSRTGQAFGLPADARQASVEAQAVAAAKLTAENAAVLKRQLNGEPTPGELYISHFLGAGDAVRVLQADPEARLDQILSAKVIEANSFLRNWSAADAITWADGKMQGAMTDVGARGALEGRTVADNAASVPLDTAVTLAGVVSTKRAQLQAEAERQQREMRALIDPTKSHKDKDPAHYAMRSDRAIAERYADAVLTMDDPQTTPEGAARVWESTIEESLEEQRAALIPEHAQKVLPNTYAKPLVQGLNETQGEGKVLAFQRLQQQFGAAWPKVYGELTEQGLPSDFSVLGFLDPSDTLSTAIVGQTLGTNEADLKKDLGTVGSTIGTDLLDPVEDHLADFFAAFTFGAEDSARAQVSGLAETLRKVALVHFRQHRDIAAAQRFATSLIDDNFEVLTTSSIHAIIPREHHLAAVELEYAAAHKQRRIDIEAFNPEPIGSDVGGPDFLNRQRTIATAVNSGVWTGTPAGDGLMLLVPFGRNTTAYIPLQNERGEFFTIKFNEIPVLVRKAKAEGAAPPYGRPSTLMFGPTHDLTPEEEAAAMGRTERLALE